MNEREKFQYSYELNETKECIEILLDNYTDYNVYMAQNTFINHYRRKNWAWCSEAIIIDIDFYKIEELQNLPAENIVKLMELEGLFDFLQPSYCIDSGNGLNLVFLLEKVPLYQFQNNIKLWENVAKAMTKKFENFGADKQATDITRINRLPGTVNQKTGRKVKILDFENLKKKKLNKYSLSELADELLEYTKEEIRANRKKQKKKKKNKNKVKSLNTLHKLHWSRMKDYKKITNLRDGDMKGYRELILFLYSLSSIQYTEDEGQTYKEVQKLNSQFTQPLQEKEVEHAYNSAYNSFLKKFESDEDAENSGFYKYKNETIRELLEVQKNEMKDLLVLIDEREKLRREKYKKKQERRNKNGLTKKQQQKHDKMEIIAKLINEGKKQKEIAEELKLAKCTVSKYAKEIKETTKK